MESQKLKLCTNRRLLFHFLSDEGQCTYVHIFALFWTVYFHFFFWTLLFYGVTSRAAYSIEFVSHGTEKSPGKFMEIRHIKKFRNPKFKMKMFNYSPKWNCLLYQSLNTLFRLILFYRSDVGNVVTVWGMSS